MIVARGSVRAYPGEARCGDAVLVEETSHGVLLALVDALGHGPVAADAADLAMETIQAHREVRPLAILEACHRTLLRGRGAAISVISFDRQGRGVFAGVGNVSVRILPESPRNAVLLPAAGVIGHRYRPPREAEFRLPLDGVGVLYSDGISSRVDPLEGARTSLVETCAGLLAKHAKPTDDASLIVFAHSGSLRFATT